MFVLQVGDGMSLQLRISVIELRVYNFQPYSSVSNRSSFIFSSNSFAFPFLESKESVVCENYDGENLCQAIIPFLNLQLSLYINF